MYRMNWRYGRDVQDELEVWERCTGQTGGMGEMYHQRCVQTGVILRVTLYEIRQSKNNNYIPTAIYRLHNVHMYPLITIIEVLTEGEIPPGINSFLFH